MFRVRKIRDEKYFYALNAHDSRLVRMLGLLGVASTLFVVLGYYQFLHISPYLAAFFSPVLIIITLYYLIQYALLVFYPGFDLSRHKQKVADFWHIAQKTGRAPRVAVFIPAAGESVEVVEGTLRAATNIEYSNFHVFVLDDSKEAIYKTLATDLHVGYIRRENVGEGKKAGNMNHALGQIRGYDYILVLDADFQARPEILHELVPYAGDDVGIVQSPQHFPLDNDAHRRSKIEYGAAYIQQDFYRITQVARNRFGAAICVGTSALYNIQALKRVGGYEGVGQPRGWAHSEDVHTGLKMLNFYNPADKRYRIVYVPIQLAKGSCPDTHHSFYKQQNRWATGSMQLMLSGKTLFSSRLSLPQRFIYGSNSLYYFYTMTVLLSPVYLLALALSDHPSSWAFTLYFIPSLIFKHVIEPYVLRKQRAPLATSLVVLSNAYTFLQALILLIIRRPLGWEATGTKGTKKSAHFTYFKLVATIAFVLLYIVTLGVLIMNDRFQLGPSMFIVCLFLVAFLSHVSFLFYTLIIGGNTSKRWADRKLYAMVMLVIVIIAVVGVSSMYRSKYDIVLTGDHLSLGTQRPYTSSTGTVLDGYRRMMGDIRQLLHI
ncbi:MAG TPA: glycosyltransferase [Verrucomicrobiae bacterium]|nr:glycosyltransferase [Verrucomicrobiae bacterium]